MAIDLLNSFLQRAQNVTSNQKSTTSQTTQSAQNIPQSMQVMRAIKALQAGQTLQGEIVSVKGDEVQLAILKDMIIDAKLAQSMNLTPGTTMPFLVKANNNQGLSLMPLFTNIAADPNALKALDMAQIPVNERSLEMVRTMMEKGMPIDKQAIQEMYRDVAGFKEAPVKDVVALHQMKMPVNQENLTQLSLYQNNQHYLKDIFSEMGNAIGNHLESLIADGKTENALNLVNELQHLFQNGEAGEQGKTAPIVFTEEMLLNEEKKLQQEVQKSVDTEKQTINNKNVDILNENQVSDAKKEIGTQSQEVKEQITWKDLSEALSKEKVPGEISKIFEKIWSKETVKNWMMEPETVMEKKNVKEFYEKLDNQIRHLEKIFEEGNFSKSPAAKVIQNAASNLDFINQLNQMHAYIQLPLKMTNQNAHGELYVFTNKRNMTKQDGKVTALLHLDMEHLGKLDIYVSLEKSKVSTNFYLEKEEYLDFLEEHMDLLTQRLNKRGYSCDIKTALRNSEESVIKTIEKQQENPMLLSMQAFDVRA